MLPDRVSNPGPLTYESGALPIALRGPATEAVIMYVHESCLWPTRCTPVLFGFQGRKGRLNL